jgi:hypothetical protein
VIRSECLMCGDKFDLPEENDDLVVGKFSGGTYSICPTCHRYADIGKAVVEKEQSTDCYCNHQSMCWVCLTQDMLAEMKGAAK